MNVLIDTNILIPLEPTSIADIEPTTELAAELSRLANAAGIRFFVHPAQLKDLARDKNQERARARAKLLQKYQTLAAPPSIAPELEAQIGTAPRDSNDEVDNFLLAAVAAPAVDYLITNDSGIHRKATRASLSDRVFLLADAVAAFKKLFDKTVSPPPAVEHVKAHQLDRRDPIWTSFGEDYEGFLDWLAKCMREQRDAWVIRSGSGYAGVLIVNREENPPRSTAGKVLKICSFKTSESHYGLRYGELLLKTVFRYAERNQYDWLFVDVLPKHAALAQLLADFGFERTERKVSGEDRYAKPMRPISRENRSGLDFNVRFGPAAVDWTRPMFIVPILPMYEAILFPDQQSQQRLLEGEQAFGNAIRKAYLSRSSIKPPGPGDLLVFYRSEDVQALTALGVVESALRSSDADEIARFVAKRTVYSYQQITELAQSPVLAIRFRHARHIMPNIRLHELRRNSVISTAPQSIASVSDLGKQWIMSRLDQ